MMNILGASAGTCICQSEMMSFFNTTKNSINLIAKAKLISWMALALALFCKVAIANDQLEPGLSPSLRPAANNNRDKANKTAITTKVEANKIKVVTISPLNSHIKTKIVSIERPI